MTPGCPRDVRPKNFLFGLLFRSRKGCWRGIPEKCCGGCRESVPGTRGVPGRVLEAVPLSFAAQATALLPALFPALPLFPALIPGSPRSTFQEFLSSTPFWGQRRRKHTAQALATQGSTHRRTMHPDMMKKKSRFGDPKPSPEKCRKIPGNSGFPVKEDRNAKKKADSGNSGKFILGILNGHFGMISLGG